MQFIKNNKKLIIISGILGLILAIYLNYADPVIFREVARWPFLKNLNTSLGGLSCPDPLVISTKSDGFPFTIYDTVECSNPVNIIALATNFLIIISVTFGIALVGKAIFLKLKNTNNQN